MAPKPPQLPVFRVSIGSLPPGKGRPLPHNGLSELELAEAEARGYQPVDVRFEDGQRRVDMMAQGISIGTVILNDLQLKAFEIEARLFKEQRVTLPPPPNMTGSLLDKLADIRPGKLQNYMPEKDKTHTRPDPVKQLTELKSEDEKAIAALIAGGSDAT